MAALRNHDPDEVEATFRMHLQSFLDHLLGQLPHARVDRDANRLVTSNDGARLRGRNS
jgi:hypothetical protein